MAPKKIQARCWVCKEETEVKTLYDWDSDNKGYQFNIEKKRAKCRSSARKFCRKCAHDILEKQDAKRELMSQFRREKMIEDALATMDMSGIDMERYHDAIDDHVTFLRGAGWDGLKRGSQYEVIIGIMLAYNSISFRTQEEVITDPATKGNAGTYHIDFVLPDYRLLVECDGEQYHKTTEKEQDREEKILTFYPGYRFVRIPTVAIMTNPESVMTYIGGHTS